MATNISLVTYAGQTVTPLDDALIYETSVDNGIFDGCECTLSGGNTIHMNGGHGIICGRKFTVFESDTAVPLSSGGTLNGRMKVHLDLADTGEPIQFIIETAASLPALIQQDDVNVNNGIYEFAMCTFTVSETAVTNFEQVFEQAYSATREISTFPATTAQLASTDKILVQKANGDTYSMSYSALINSLAATLITRSGTVTDAKHALSAAENNPNVSNSLAAKISALNSSIAVYSLTSSENLLSYAENIPAYSTKYVYIGNSDRTNLPSNIDQYSVAKIVKASYAAIVVEVYSYTNPTKPTAYCQHTGSGWGAWTYIPKSSVTPPIIKERYTQSVNLTQNAMTVVEFAPTVPDGYTFLAAYDSSYLANITGTFIRYIDNKAVFNYYSLAQTGSKSLSAEIIWVATSLLS